MERRDLETVRYEKDGPVARVILNRPDKANAQNSAMVWDVENCLKDAEADYDVKVVLLKATGAGFCAGHDVGSAMSFPEFVQARQAGHPWGGSDTLFLWPVLHLWEFPKPTVAAVHGYSLGGGTYFALLPDLDAAAETIAQQIGQAPLSVLMGIKAGVKRAWETMGMRVHLQSQFHIMWQVAAAGDVAAWQQENIEHGYGPLPRRVAAQRAEAAARRAAARAARDGADS